MKKIQTFNYEVFTSADDLAPEDRNLFQQAVEARGKAYAQYSNFFVGCAVLLDNGEVVLGNNQENAAYPSGLCAERTAVFWASANFPGVGIDKIFVAGAPQGAPVSQPVPPCGACRQSILEYENRQNKPIQIFFGAPGGKIIKIEAVRDLLPFSFDASFL